MTRVLVCGGRRFADENLLRRTLWHIHDSKSISAIIHGSAVGADSMAEDWAENNGIPVDCFMPDWRQGRKAGPLRNQRMIDEGEPDLCVAFAGGRGTADMVRRAKKAGIEVITPC